MRHKGYNKLAYKLHYFFYRHTLGLTHKLWMLKLRLKYKHLLAK